MIVIVREGGAMDLIVCYTRSLTMKALVEGIEGFRVVIVDTTADLAYRLVEEHDVVCAIIHVAELDDFWRRFLISMDSGFPHLETILMLEKGEYTGPMTIIQGDPSAGAVFSSLENRLLSLGRRNKRGNQRFDWPLKGVLQTSDGYERSFNVREISAGGAFLESAGVIPPSGTTGSLSIRFHDFKILTNCEVVAARAATGRLPDGFGVRFTDLTDFTRKVLDSIVSDELLRSLVEPGSPPRPPALAP
jgi:hypothetical protein